MRANLTVLLLLLSAAPSAAKDYFAERFDVTIAPATDGSIQVTETVRFAFTDGTFTFVTREIPTAWTDGIEVLGASMDGRVLPRGNTAGQVEIGRSRSRVRVQWHFQRTANSAHEFRVSYIARGVIRPWTGGGALLAWQALPEKHDYRITRSRIRINAERFVRPPSVETRRTAGALAPQSDHDGWSVTAGDVGRDGWIKVTALLPEAYAQNRPAWQVNRQRERELLAPMLMYAALAALATLVLLGILWLQFPGRPAVDVPHDVASPPAPRAPAVAAAVLSGGRPASSQAIGTLFDLAHRGVLTITETGRGRFGTRRFELRRGGGAPAAEHESALVALLLKDGDHTDLAKSARRLATGGGKYRQAVRGELEAQGLLDAQRRGARRRLMTLALIIDVAAMGAAVYLLVERELLPAVAIPIAVSLVATAGMIVGALLPELSDEGYRERERWRAFRVYLRDALRAPEGSDLSLVVSHLPYAMAFGLAPQVVSAFKKSGSAASVPPWFRAMADADASASFAALIGVTHASGGHSSSGGSGAAGGGSSGAG